MKCYEIIRYLEYAVIRLVVTGPRLLLQIALNKKEPPKRIAKNSSWEGLGPNPIANHPTRSFSRKIGNGQNRAIFFFCLWVCLSQFLHFGVDARYKCVGPHTERRLAVPMLPYYVNNDCFCLFCQCLESCRSLELLLFFIHSFESFLVLRIVSSKVQAK